MNSNPWKSSLAFTPDAVKLADLEADCSLLETQTRWDSECMDVSESAERTYLYNIYWVYHPINK